MRKFSQAFVLGALLGAALLSGPSAIGEPAPDYDVLITGGTIYDGSGGPGFLGDVAIKADRIVYVGPHASGKAAKVVDAKGKAVSPGFVNMLSWATESLLVDGRGQSDLRQGVTLEVMGEGTSMGPINDSMRAAMTRRQQDIKYTVDWKTLGDYLSRLERQGIAPNVASFVGAATVRENELGEEDVDPTPGQLSRMQALVHQAMEEGALGVGSSLIYAPDNYAKTPELIALASEAGKCGGMYTSHMRSEGRDIMGATDELIEIGRKAHVPVEMYHMKLGGQPYWGELPELVAKIEAARASGVRVTADMYTYTAGATGLDAAMPVWVQAGGVEKWVERLKDPKIRARVLAEMRDPSAKYENLYRLAGSEGTLLLGFKTEKLKPLTGKTLAAVAKMRGTNPEDTIIDLIIEDGTRVDVAYFLMSEENVAKEVALPFVSFGSDEAAQAPEGVFLKKNSHPRAYGNFVRVLGKYVRDDKVISLPEAIRKLAALPASNLSLKDRGMLKDGYFADVVIFDPDTVQDHATYDEPQQFATGVSDVFVNGVQALKDGEPTGAHSGRFVRGRAWTGYRYGGCRASASEWTYTQ